MTLYAFTVTQEDRTNIRYVYVNGITDILAFNAAKAVWWKSVTECKSEAALCEYKFDDINEFSETLTEMYPQADWQYLPSLSIPESVDVLKKLPKSPVVDWEYIKTVCDIKKEG